MMRSEFDKLRALCAQPSSCTVDHLGDGTVILSAETYDILAKRANALSSALDEIEEQHKCVSCKGKGYRETMIYSNRQGLFNQKEKCVLCGGKGSFWGRA